MKPLNIFINNESIFEFNREITLDDGKLAFLDKMDSDMEKGIKIHGELITNPDSQQRATFIVMNLIKALQQDNDAAISASCAYLVNRYPAATEIHVNEVDDAVMVELVEEE